MTSYSNSEGKMISLSMTTVLATKTMEVKSGSNRTVRYQAPRVPKNANWITMSKNSHPSCSLQVLSRKSSSPWHLPRKAKNPLLESNSPKTSWTRFLKKLIIKRCTSSMNTTEKLTLTRNYSQLHSAKKKKCTKNTQSQSLKAVNQVPMPAKPLQTLSARKESLRKLKQRLNLHSSNLKCLLLNNPWLQLNRMINLESQNLLLQL